LILDYDTFFFFKNFNFKFEAFIVVIIGDLLLKSSSYSTTFACGFT